jgi:phospholipid/cholesterol/gamma-HCH transport system substrate-binding protein
MRGAAELRVGLFAVVAIAAMVYVSMATRDNPFKDQGYTLHARLGSAQGLRDGSAVELAGVKVGAIDVIRVEENQAVADISMKSDFKLPLDSKVVVASRGLLGDTLLKITTGTAVETLGDGDWIEASLPPPSIADLQSQLGTIATDIQAITGSLRLMLDSEETRGSVTAIIRNVEGLTGEFESITRRNGEDLDAVIDNMRRLTESIAEIVDESRPDIADELDAIKQATGTLNQGLIRVESIAAKIDEGEGTIGQLVNDDTLIRSVNDTVADIGDLVASVNRFQIEVLYRGEFHFTHRGPTVGFGMKNTVGVRVKPKPDYWYLFEFVDDPQGDLDEEVIYNDVGEGYDRRSEVTRKRSLQVSLMFAKRFKDLVLRFGLKEGTGGAGVDLYLLHDRLSFHLDVHDFKWAGWPERIGVPNVHFRLQVVPMDHIYVTAGVDNIVNGIVSESPTWFVGAGLWFTDNDLKWILGNLPLGAL